MRNALGSLIALIGAAATLVSPWRPWYNNRHGSSYKFYEVFGSGITVSRSGIMDSVFLVFLVTAIVAVVGVVMRSRALVLGAGVVAFGFAILWMIRQGQAAGELTITGTNSRGLGSGLAYAFGGGLLMIIGSLMMTGRPRRTVTAERSGAARAADQGTYGTAAATTAGASTTAAPAPAPPAKAAPTITTTAPADKNRAAQPPAPAPAQQQAQDQAAVQNQAQTPAETTPAAERTGTERLSKEERQMLGLDEDASAEQKKQN